MPLPSAHSCGKCKATTTHGEANYAYTSTIKAADPDTFEELPRTFLLTANATSTITGMAAKGEVAAAPCRSLSGPQQHIYSCTACHIPARV
jgi:hypothetical protein